FETYIGTPAYMDIAALNRVMMVGPTVSGAHLAVDRRDEVAFYRELKNTPAVAAVTLRRAAIGTFRDTMAETMYILIFFFVLFACLLAFGVVYNSVRISLSERGRELASLRVLGFTRGEVSYILLGEIAVLILLALPLGCLLGLGLSWFILQAIDNELYRIPFAIEPFTYGFAMSVTALAAMVSGLIVRRRIDRLDLIAVLKTRE
ncbi:MAG: ABC transporter permease, partial [Alphaproteobacteria bacterium]